MTDISHSLHDAWRVFRREMRLVLTDAGALLFLLFLPLAYPVFYSLIYNGELVRDVPVALVDDCRTAASRAFVRKLDATEYARVAFVAANMREARKLMANKEVYAIVRLPRDFSRRTGRMEQAGVEAYYDMSVLMRYKSVLMAVSYVSQDMGSVAQAQTLTGIAAPPPGSALPVPYRTIALGNPTTGLASAIMPGILVLVLQQSFLLLIALVMASSRERARQHGGADPLAVRAGAFATLSGKSACYLLLMVPATIYLWHVVPAMFHFPQTGATAQLALLALPFMLAVVFFGMSLQAVVRHREAVFPVIVVTSIFFLFLAGITWPRYAMSPLWQAVGNVLPTTWGVQAVWGINSLGASLQQQGQACQALWTLAAIYAVTAYAALRLQGRHRQHTL